MTFTDEKGQRFMVVGIVSIHPGLRTFTDERAFQLVRIPDGMTELDLGRKFKHAPTFDDMTRYELIGSDAAARSLAGRVESVQSRVRRAVDESAA